MPAHTDDVGGLQPPEPPTAHISGQIGVLGKVEIVADVDATKADSDKKSYRLVRLPNGLRALLIHDPPAPQSDPAKATVGEEGDHDSEEDDIDDVESDGNEESDEDGGNDEEDEEDEDGEGEEPEGLKKAAAAMAVGVGSLSDPEHCQGLAHYLEHMLFMGSVKYPDENEYDSFISQMGGSSNAFTECEYTLYHFDVLPHHLEKALDIFAQFFVSPLMKAESSDRELQSIESEFCLSKNSDTCRLQELWCHTSKPGHPFSKFCWGNLWSLRDVPFSKKVDVRQELVRFHDKHYRAPAMQLVVLGGHTLDELEKMVLESFSSVAPGTEAGGGGEAGGLPAEAATVAAAGLPFAEDSLGRVFRVQPVKDFHRLHVTWQLREQLSLYKKKPAEYIGHLVGHEGEGSVLSALRYRRWATGISAGVYGLGYSSSSCCAMFSVAISLTKAGVRHWPDIMELLFRYIGMLRTEGPQEWVFREIRDVADLQYRFQEESEPAECVEQLAEQMLPVSRYEDKHILNGPHLMEKWDPALIEELLGELSPSTARYDLQSSLFGRAVDDAAASLKAGGDNDMDDDEDDDDDDDDGEDEDEDDDGSDDDDDEDDDEEECHPLAKKPEETPLREPRFGVAFWSDPVPQELLDTWSSLMSPTATANATNNNPTSTGNTGGEITTVANNDNDNNNNHKVAASAAGAPPGLHLPKPNPFIPSEFAVKDMQQKAAVTTTAVDDGKTGSDGRRDTGIATSTSSGSQKVAKIDEAQRKGARDAAAVAAVEGSAGADAGMMHAVPLRSPRRVRESSGASGGGDDSKVILWHLQDQAFRQPRAEIYLKVVTAVANEDPRSAALSELVVRLVNDSLTEYSYAAYVAELHYDLKATDTGFQIHVFGFDHKAPLLLREVLKRLLNMEAFIKEGPLSMQLEALIRGYHNVDMKPGKHASNARIQALRPGRWSPEQKQAALEAVADERAKAPKMDKAGSEEESASAGVLSVEDVTAFLSHLFSSIEIECFVHGNFTDHDAGLIFNDIEKVAADRSSKKQDVEAGGKFQRPEERVVRLNASQHVLYCCTSKDPTEQNCALEVYWQIGEDNLEQRVLADAIDQVMSEPLYDQLRTKEQLGYSVSCSPRLTYGVLGFCITAQSAAYGPAHLYRRVRAFMKSFRDTMASMTDKVFSTHMSSAAANKLQPDNTLNEEAQRHWPEINSGRRTFHVNVQEAHAMRLLEQSAVLKAYEEWFLTGATRVPKPCLTLTVTGGGGKFTAADETKEMEIAIADDREGSPAVPNSPVLVRIATPQAIFSPAEDRDLFPNLLG